MPEGCKVWSKSTKWRSTKSVGANIDTWWDICPVRIKTKWNLGSWPEGKTLAYHTIEIRSYIILSIIARIGFLSAEHHQQVVINQAIFRVVPVLMPIVVVVGMMIV